MKWRQLRSLGYAAAKRRTARDPVGTAYWGAHTGGNRLYVKIRENGWLCFGGKSIEACLNEFATKPGVGGAASDYLIANGITTTNPKHKSVLSTAKLEIAKKTRTLSARLAPEDQWRVLEQRGAQVVRRAVTAKSIAAAEATLKFSFPPSYKRLVSNGAPGIGPPGASSSESLSYAVLTPPEVVRATRELRKLHKDMFEDPASLPRVKAELANAVMFQIGSNAGEGYVFLVDTADKSGEMRIGSYHHDFVEWLDWYPSSKAVFRSLATAMFNATSQIAADLP